MDEIDSIGSSRLEGGSGGMISHKNILLVIIILVDSTISKLSFIIVIIARYFSNFHSQVTLRFKEQCWNY